MIDPRLVVLHVVQSMNYGGMERVIADLITWTNPERFKLHLLCLEYLGRFSSGLENAAELHVASPMSAFSFVHPAGLAREIAAIAPNIVHTHSGVWFKGSLAARKANVPVVLHTEHGRRSPDPLSDRFFDGLAARRTDAVVAVSEKLSRELPRSLRIAAGKVVCIPNGVDAELYRPLPDSGAVRRELGLSANDTIIGSIGRLEPIKGYDMMIEAFARLLDAKVAPDAHLVIAGDGTVRDELQSLAARLGVASRVHLLGWRDDTRDLLSAFTLFTMSSRSEGTSISLLEAMSAGLSPVVTDVGGNRAVLGASLADALVPLGDVQAMADAWTRTISEPGLRAARSAVARRRVIDSFDTRAVAAAYDKLYDALARRQHAPASDGTVPPSVRLTGNDA